MTTAAPNMFHPFQDKINKMLLTKPAIGVESLLTLLIIPGLSLLIRLQRRDKIKNKYFALMHVHQIY